MFHPFPPSPHIHWPPHVVLHVLALPLLHWRNVKAEMCRRSGTSSRFHMLGLSHSCFLCHLSYPPLIFFIVCILSVPWSSFFFVVVSPNPSASLLPESYHLFPTLCPLWEQRGLLALAQGGSQDAQVVLRLSLPLFSRKPAGPLSQLGADGLSANPPVADSLAGTTTWPESSCPGIFKRV